MLPIEQLTADVENVLEAAKRMPKPPAECTTVLEELAIAEPELLRGWLVYTNAASNLKRAAWALIDTMAAYKCAIEVAGSNVSDRANFRVYLAATEECPIEMEHAAFTLFDGTLWFKDEKARTLALFAHRSWARVERLPA